MLSIGTHNRNVDCRVGIVNQTFINSYNVDIEFHSVIGGSSNTQLIKLTALVQR